MDHGPIVWRRLNHTEHTFSDQDMNVTSHHIYKQIKWHFLWSSLAYYNFILSCTKLSDTYYGLESSSQVDNMFKYITCQFIVSHTWTWTNSSLLCTSRHHDHFLCWRRPRVEVLDKAGEGPSDVTCHEHTVKSLFQAHFRCLQFSKVHIFCYFFTTSYVNK
jgi:hypothetical protein